MKKIGKHLTFANVVACAALFIALGGASYAAFKLPKNSVGTRQIKAGAVTSAKIKAKAIGQAQINLAALGTVPDAAHAAAADNATKAATATKATSADSLGGLSPQQIIAAARPMCPADTTEAAGLCFEKKERPEEKVWTVALKTCAANGRFLPSISELAAFLVQVNPPQELADPDEWVSDLWRNESSGASWTYSFDIKPSGDPLLEVLPISAGSKPFRCVTAPE